MSETTTQENKIPDIIALETEHQAHQQRLEALGREALELGEMQRIHADNVRREKAADKRLVTDWYANLVNTPELYGLSFYLDPPRDEVIPEHAQYIVPEIQRLHFRGKALVRLNDLLSQGPQPVLVFNHNTRGLGDDRGDFHSFEATIGMTATEEPLSVKYDRKVAPMTGTVSLEPQDVVLQLGLNKRFGSRFGGWDDEIWFEGSAPVVEQQSEHIGLLSRYKSLRSLPQNEIQRLTFDNGGELTSFQITERSDVHVGRAAIMAILIQSGADIRSQPYDSDTFTAITQTASEIIKEPINIS